VKRKPKGTSKAVTAEAAAQLWEQSEAVVKRVLGE